MFDAHIAEAAACFKGTLEPQYPTASFATVKHEHLFKEKSRLRLAVLPSNPNVVNEAPNRGRIVWVPTEVMVSDMSKIMRVRLLRIPSLTDTTTDGPVLTAHVRFPPSSQGLIALARKIVLERQIIQLASSSIVAGEGQRNLVRGALFFNWQLNDPEQMVRVVKLAFAPQGSF